MPLEIVVKKAARIITFSGFIDHSKPLLAKLGFQTINSLWMQFVLINFYKIMNGMTHLKSSDYNCSFETQSDCFISRLRSSSNRMVQLTKFKTKYGQNTFANVAARSWNDLPLEIRNDKKFSLNQFKALVKRNNNLTLLN